MRLAKAFALTTLLGIALATSAHASEILAEHVTGGTLDLPWVGGFQTSNNVMYGKTLEASDPAYANPSGDHTVAVAQNSSPDSGGIIVTTTNPGPLQSNYAWEGWIFTGNGETRRGLLLRADPTNDFQTFYMFVIEPGLAKLRFRKFVNAVPTTIKEWLAFTDIPAGQITPNAWHKLKVVADGNQFTCSFDDVVLPGQPIVDSDIAGGYVGVYNFRFDLGNVPVYFDDLVLSCVSEVTASLEVVPHDLNLKSKGKYVTVFVEPPAPHLASEIDVASLQLNGVPAETDPAPKLADHDSRLEVKFSRSALAATLTAGDQVPVTLTGAIAGSCLSAVDRIKVKGPKLHAPRLGDQLAAGQTADVTWDVDPDATSMTLLASYDDGATWRVEASNVANTGSYRWRVPAVATSAARLQLVSVYGTDETGIVNQSEYAASDAFTIATPLGVGDDGAALSLRVPNPVAGSFSLGFSLANADAASLAVFDIAGRAVLSREVGGHAGTQRVQMSALPAGIYVVRLAQSGRAVTSRFTVVR